MRTIMLNLREDEVLTVIDALDLQRAELDPFVPANGPRAGHLKDLADFLQELLHPETFPDGHPAQVRARALQPQPEAREVDNTGDYIPLQPEAREEGVGFSSFLHRLPKTDSGHEVGMMEVGYDANGQLCWGPRWLDINQTDEILRAALSRLAAKEQQGWISVKERLPEKTQYVLVYADGAMGCLVWNHEHSQWEDWTNQKIPNIARDFITHWMPLPAAPATSEKPEEGHA